MGCRCWRSKIKPPVWTVCSLQPWHQVSFNVSESFFVILHWDCIQKNKHWICNKIIIMWWYYLCFIVNHSSGCLGFFIRSEGQIVLDSPGSVFRFCFREAECSITVAERRKRLDLNGSDVLVSSDLLFFMLGVFVLLVFRPHWYLSDLMQVCVSSQLDNISSWSLSSSLFCFVLVCKAQFPMMLQGSGSEETVACSGWSLGWKCLEYFYEWH